VLSPCLRKHGTFGLIATNTIGQGDTRLDWTALDLSARRRIYCVLTKRIKWPGTAAVVVSVVHVAKGQMLCLRSTGASVD
jgi:hypothetical protein